jgi:mRNA-degrading endonuclease RelE of RelBE toxin-antitoxin system
VKSAPRQPFQASHGSATQEKERCIRECDYLEASAKPQLKVKALVPCRQKFAGQNAVAASWATPVARRNEDCGLRRQWITVGTTILMSTFQIIFTPTSAAELARMPKELQLQILGDFRGLPQHVIASELEDFGKLESDGHLLHRFRIGDYRVYFERHTLGVLVHRILSRNTLKDFFFRSGIKVGEDQALQENPKFWELIEAAKSSEKK